MESFEFNGVSSESLGIVVKELPLLSRAERNIDTITVNGRNGNLHIDNCTYKSRPYTISCIVLDKSKMDEINKTYLGIGILKLSKYTDRYFKATIKNQISFEKYLSVLNEFPLQFEIEPISYSNEEIVEEITMNSSINVGGNEETFPIVTIIGIGTITINGYSLKVTESNITIDSELMICICDGIAKEDKVILDDFPRLTPGDNEITLDSGIEKIIIKYRKGWL